MRGLSGPGSVRVTVVLLTVDADPDSGCRVGGLNAFPPGEWNHALTGLVISNAISLSEHHDAPVSVSIDDEWLMTVSSSGLSFRRQMRTPAEVGPAELEEFVGKMFALLSVVIDEMPFGVPT